MARALSGAHFLAPYEGRFPHDLVRACHATFLFASKAVAQLVMQKHFRINMKKWALHLAASDRVVGHCPAKPLGLSL